MGEFSRELRAYLDHSDAEAIDRVGERLTNERPLPPARFRSGLRAHLHDLASAGAMGPRRLGLAIAGYAGAGGALLAVAALGLAGTGPLAP